MIVSLIVNCDKPESERNVSLHDCARAYVFPRDDGIVVVTMEGMRDGTCSHEIPMKTSRVYVMNDQGKTVESFRWN